MVTCGMYDAAGDWVSAVGMPAKSGVGGGIIAVLPGQLGIGVYSPLLDAKGNSVRGVRVCRSLSQRLGLHFLTVSRESRSTIRAIYDADDSVRVYEVHGDLLFAGAEQVMRTVTVKADRFDVAILDVSRVDDDRRRRPRPARPGMRATLSSVGKEGFPGRPGQRGGAGRKTRRLRRASVRRARRRGRGRERSPDSALDEQCQCGGFAVPARRHGIAESPMSTITFGRVLHRLGGCNG